MENFMAQKKLHNKKSENLKKPLYLNECDCKNLVNCKVCRSKYNKKAREYITEAERVDLRAYANLRYANRSDEEIARARKIRMEKYRNRTPEQIEKKAARRRELARIKREKARANEAILQEAKK